MNKIIEKLKGVLEAEDLQKLEEAIQKMVDDKVAVLTEEKTTELEKLAEEFVGKELSARLIEETKKIEESYDEKMVALEEKVVNNLDKFLDSEINEKISDDTLNKIAINETCKPIVDEIVKIFEEKYVALDTEGHTILKEAKEAIETLEEEKSAMIAEKMEIKEENDKLKAKLLIAEKTDGLTEDQKDRVAVFFEGKDYDEINSKIDNFIEVISESNTDDSDDDRVNEDVDTDDRETLEESVKEKTKTHTEEETTVSKANGLL